jgi:hypothetical protein
MGLPSFMTDWRQILPAPGIFLLNLNVPFKGKTRDCPNLKLKFCISIYFYGPDIAQKVREHLL